MSRHYLKLPDEALAALEARRERQRELGVPEDQQDVGGQHMFWQPPRPGRRFGTWWVWINPHQPALAERFRAYKPRHLRAAWHHHRWSRRLWGARFGDRWRSASTHRKGTKAAMNAADEPQLVASNERGGTSTRPAAHNRERSDR